MKIQILFLILIIRSVSQRQRFRFRFRFIFGFWLRFRFRLGAHRTEFGTPRIGVRAQLFRTQPRKRSGSSKYVGKELTHQRGPHLSPFFPQIDGNEPGGPKFRGAISTWEKLMDPFLDPNHYRMLLFWKIRGVGVIGL